MIKDSSQDLKLIDDLMTAWKVDEKRKLTLLGGGVSNLVVKVETANETFVVKSSLPKLRVQDDWFADRSRIARESSCLRVIAEYVGSEFAPKVLREDVASYACALECAPEGTVTWKHDLLAGKVDSSKTSRVANFLARFHNATWDDRKIREEFRDQSNFVQLRINPYLVTVSQRHPDLKPSLDNVIHGLLSRQLCLVHGDFSPKNILLLPDGRIWIIDCEVAHYGNPAFDVAFCVNHLLLKAVHLSSPMLLAEARRFWTEYWTNASNSEEKSFTVTVLGALMLARVDGKSPVEYLNEENRRIVREMSRGFVLSRTDDFDVLTKVVESVIR
jgi:5-methylthioribose kinase